MIVTARQMPIIGSNMRIWLTTRRISCGTPCFIRCKNISKKILYFFVSIRHKKILKMIYVIVRSWSDEASWSTRIRRSPTRISNCACCSPSTCSRRSTRSLRFLPPKFYKWNIQNSYIWNIFLTNQSKFAFYFLFYSFILIEFNKILRFQKFRSLYLLVYELILICER